MTEKRYSVTKPVPGTPMKEYLINGQRPLGEKECLKLLEPLIRELGKAQTEGQSGFAVCPDELIVRPDGTVVYLRAEDMHTTGAEGNVHPRLQPDRTI